MRSADHEIDSERKGRPTLEGGTSIFAVSDKIPGMGETGTPDNELANHKENLTRYDPALVALNRTVMELICTPYVPLEKKRLAALCTADKEELLTVPLVQSAASIEKGLAVISAPSISVPLHSRYVV